MTTLNIESLHPSDLAPSDLRAWREMAMIEPAFSSPLLSPDFAQAVGAVRKDARVAVIRRAGEALGFLAHHRRPGGLARPIGAPLSDYHALVSRADLKLDARQVLSAAGLTTFRYSGLVDPFALFGQPSQQRTAHHIALGEAEAQTYLEAVRAASPKKIKNWRRLSNKLEREVGVIGLRAPDASPGAFEQLIAWKRAQLQRTGVHDFLGPDWTRALMADLFSRRDGPLQGLMINLYAGDQHIGGHFGVRAGEVYHPWIASTNPAYADWSPGQIFFLQAIAAMPALGLKLYDLGPGHDHYKGAYALSQVLIGEGAASASNMGGRLANSLDGIWALAGAEGAGSVGKLRRRMDAIASVELTLGGRVRGLASAVTSHAQRLAG